MGYRKTKLFIISAVLLLFISANISYTKAINNAKQNRKSYLRVNSSRI